MGKEGRTVYLYVDLYLSGWQRAIILILETEDSTIQSALLALLVYLYSGVNSKCFWERIVKNDFGLQLAWDHDPHWGKRQKTGSNRKNIGEQSKRSACFFVFFRQSRFFSPFRHNEKPDPRLVYSQTEKTVNTRNISGMLLCCAKKQTNKQTNKKSGVRKLNGKQERQLQFVVLWLVRVSWSLL